MSGEGWIEANGGATAAQLRVTQGLAAGAAGRLDNLQDEIYTRIERLRRSFQRGAPAKYAAAAPTITMGAAGAASSITGSTTPAISAGAANIATIGTLLYFNGSVYMGRHIDLVSTPGAADSTGRGWGQAVMTDSDQLEVKVRAISGQVLRFNARIDGEYYSDTDISLSGDNTDRHVLLNFGSAKPSGRKVELFFNASAWLYGYNVTANRRVWHPTYAGEPLAMVFGDSYTDGVGSTNIRRTMVNACGSALGISNMIASGAGGTGYINNGSSAKFITRIADISRFGALDLLVIAGGINDAGNSQASVTTAATDFLNAVIAAQPKAIIAVCGPFRAPSLNPSQGVSDGIKAAFNAVKDSKRMFFIDTFANNWQNGTGKIGATNGTGNSDFYIINSDGVHPSDDGHEYLGTNLAEAIKFGVAALA
ncbi:SGNH/GDSL hydrolase family protein [Xanthobacter flavus]|uniref:SGNH/GDSL hydrolase family protein n=1 Tax=Xanthobacter flavus TaxID=281 RepID=UPI003728B324